MMATTIYEDPTSMASDEYQKLLDFATNFDWFGPCLPVRVVVPEIDSSFTTDPTAVSSLAFVPPSAPCYNRDMDKTTVTDHKLLRAIYSRSTIKNTYQRQSRNS